MRKKRNNYFHEFRQSKKISMQTNFVFVDTETFSVKDGDTEKLYYKLGCAIFWNRNKSQIVKKSYWYKYKSFWDDVESKFNKENQHLYLFAHNCYFDFKMLNGFQELFKRDWFLDNHYIKGSTFIMTFKKQYASRKFYTLHVWDTYNYIKKPLADIGESVGFPKLKVNFDDVHDKELEIYCKRDTEILFEFIRQLINFLVVNKLSKLTATIGSLSFSAFRHKFYNPKENKIFIHNWKRAIKLERESYKGGITDNFRIGSFQDVYKTDINSMYPYVMRNNLIPTKLVFNGSEAKYNQKKLMKLYKVSIDLGYACIMKVKIKLSQKNAYILSSIPKKSMFIHGEFIASLCQPELDFVQKYGKILRIYHINVYKVNNIFKEFVDFFYNLKVQYLKDNNKINAEISKLYLNNQYGKWGQRNIEYERVKTDTLFYKQNYEILMLMFERKKQLILDNDICYLGTIIDTAEIYIIDKKVFALKQTNNNSHDSFVAIASFITSYARMLLIKYLNIAKRENAYYCDTDSLFLNKLGYDNLVKANCVNEYELGMLKNEGLVNASFYAPKYYDYIDVKDDGIFHTFLKKRKCKGIKKGSVLISENGNKAVYEIKIWEKFKTDLKKGNLSEQIIVDSVKEANKVYTKGKIDNDGFVKPFSIDEVMTYT
jgi:hypothetical protein